MAKSLTLTLKNHTFKGRKKMIYINETLSWVKIKSIEMMQEILAFAFEIHLKKPSSKGWKTLLESFKIATKLREVFFVKKHAL